MCFGVELFQQFRFRPSKLLHRLDVPHSLFQTLTALQNGRILRPADGHGLGQHLRGILIGPAKIPHPAQVSGRETRSISVSFAEIFSGSDSGAFLRPGADELADFTVQFHLRQHRRHQRVQCGVHGAVVYGLPNVHEFLLSGASSPVFLSTIGPYFA